VLSEGRIKMAKAKKVQIRIVESETALELAFAEVSETRAKALVKQYQQAYREGIYVQYKAVAA
jgi:hypothetical protein